MPAPNMTPARPGQVNSAGSDVALFLKKFAGEVLKAFAETNVMASRHTVRTIQGGYSAQFPATWKAAAAYHTPGNMLIGQTINSNERVITIDDLLVADVFIANIDEAKSHYEFRSVYSSECGNALAKKYDQNLLQVGVLAARASATVSGGNGGSVITNATARTNADSLIGSAFDAAQAMDEKDVPASDRFLFVKPAQYYLMVESSSKLIHRDYAPGNGSVADGTVMSVAGLKIVKTNNLPSTNVNSGPSAYQGDFTNLAALAMQRQAIGTVQLIGMAVESDYLIQNQGTLVVAKYALGHGILRPECSVEVKVA